LPRSYGIDTDTPGCWLVESCIRRRLIWLCRSPLPAYAFSPVHARTPHPKLTTSLRCDKPHPAPQQLRTCCCPGTTVPSGTRNVTSACVPSTIAALYVLTYDGMADRGQEWRTMTPHHHHSINVTSARLVASSFRSPSSLPGRAAASHIRCKRAARSSTAYVDARPISRDSYQVSDYCFGFLNRS